MRLDELGRRICIIGPSNSGKSTLAVAIGRKLGISAIHLDQLFHQPGTDWIPRGEAEFLRLHDGAIAGEGWVIDGNYSRYYQQRFKRATGLILLDVSTSLSLLRYLRRTLFERHRAGGLEGGQDSVKWDMIRHIWFMTAKNRVKNLNAFRACDLPKIQLKSAREIDQAYADWGLDRPGRG